MFAIVFICFFFRLSVAFVFLAWLLWWLFLSHASRAPRDLVSNTFEAHACACAKRDQTKSLRLVVERPDGKHGKCLCFLLLEASTVHQSHAIYVVGAFTPGSHVNTNGFELSSAQSHGIYEVFSKSAIYFSTSRPTPQKTLIIMQFLQRWFSRSKFVKAL